MGRSVDEFYDHLKTSSDAGRNLPNWCVIHFTYSTLLTGGGAISLVDQARRTISRGESKSAHTYDCR
jgi:hypothetical protein